MTRPTFPPNRTIREGQVDDGTPFVQVRGELEALWTLILGLVVGAVVGFVVGWFAAADFIHG